LQASKDFDTTRTLSAESKPLYLLYADEVNVSPNDSEFFVYSGVAIPGDRAGQLSADIDELRTKFGYRPADLLKFNTRERPPNIAPDVHLEVKSKLIRLAAHHGVKLFASFLLHKIANKGPEQARRNEINRICFHFNCFLHRADSHGLVLLDTFVDKQLNSILREKFSVGLTGLPYSKVFRLDRILGFHLASIGTSNFSSVIDIVVGSLRFAINCRTDPSKQKIASTLLKQIKPLCLLTRDDLVDELSLFFSPKIVRARTYQETYRALQQMLTDAGLKPEQSITDERNY
jgi:hypothetical protein